MDLAAFHFLTTTTGQHWLAWLAEQEMTPQSHLQLVGRLREELAPELSHALLETALLRRQATAKFSRAEAMYFTREALEQATAEPVAAHRAARFAAAGLATVADLGCGIGGDALALAASQRVIGIERDRLRLEMARHNVAAYGHARRFQPLQADLAELPPLPVSAFFFDPARRDEQGRRLYSVAGYRPPLSLLNRWRQRVPHGAAKVSPGIDYGELPPDAEVEFISLDGDVREALLWYGALRSPAQRRATLLPSGATITDRDQLAEPVPTGPPDEYLYEPDGAVIRAHLVEALAQQLGAGRIDEKIAYLTASRAQPTPFARCYRLEEALPFQLKRLRHWLRAHDVGEVTVKKRGSPLEPQELQRQLRLAGSRSVILFLTHVQGAPYVLIGNSCAAS
jgi:SAM-dependent methyltransferase